MPRLYKDGRYWYGDFTVNGWRIRRSLGVTNKTAAEVKYAFMELEFAQGRDPYHAPGGGLPLGDFVIRYLEQVAEHNSPQTLRDKRLYLARATAFFGARRPMGSVTNADVNAYVAARRKEGGSNFAVNREVATLRHLYNVAGVEPNPCRGVRRFPEPPRTITVLSKEDLDRWFAWCHEHDPFLYDLTVVAYHTGLRRGDLFAIRGGQVDLARRQLTVRISKRRGELVLYLPLNNVVLEVLARRKKQFGAKPLFPGRGVAVVVDVRARFQRALKGTGLKFRFAEFRHNCATSILAAGADLVTVQEILGHSNITTTRRYIRILDGQKRAALDKLV